MALPGTEIIIPKCLNEQKYTNNTLIINVGFIHYLTKKIFGIFSIQFLYEMKYKLSLQRGVLSGLLYRFMT